MLVVLGSKLPAPPLQMPPVATVNEPFRGATALLAQSVWSVPALAVGAGVKVMSTLSVTAAQGPLPVVVRYRRSEPEATSAAVGV